FSFTSSFRDFTAASFLATPPVNVNWSRTPPERARIDIARRMMERCRPAMMSSRLSPRLSRSRSSAPANTVQVELMRTAFVHFIGDVAQVAPAARGAAVVHLEALHDARRVDLDRLGVLAADVQHGSRAG